jgi:hypothetical protein
MASETESNAPSILASDIADDDAQSQIELPEHDEHYIYHNSKTYKRAQARPAERRDRSPNAWYWNHGEEISEDGRKRWKCKPCWEAKKFTHYTENSNRAITKHLKDVHNIIKNDLTAAFRFEVTLPADDNTGFSVTPSFLTGRCLSCG